MPLRRSSVSRLLGTHAISAAAAASLWMLTWRIAPGEITSDTTLVFGVGATLYLGAVIVHYLVAEVEASREAEEAALRFRVLAREAELKAFKAQVDPHFLFNSLNAVASLCGSRPAEAREMAQLLADFFRLTLRVGSRERITLAEEIDLVSRYLAIEKVRFGARLATHVEVDDAAAQCLVPPLLLQPLVENSVRHGIASMVEGGTISIAATASDGALRITIENPADPDRAQQKGEGIGLQNARGRLAAISGGRASLKADEKEGRYCVEIKVPVPS
jgi:LytS/YehU family sensor histidine kinase